MCIRDRHECQQHPAVHHAAECVTIIKQKKGPPGIRLSLIHILFRAYRPEVTEEQKEELRDLAHTGQEYENLMEQLTYRLGDLIGDVYGWTFPNRPECSVKGA